MGRNIAKSLKEMGKHNKILKSLKIGERNRRIIESMDFTEINGAILDKLKRGEAPSLKEVQYFIDKDANLFGSFMLKEALYGLPTEEMMWFLEEEIGDKSKALEICAGNGWFSKLLGIRAVDNYMQKNIKEIKEHYEAIGQYPIEYINSHVEKMDALEGIERYNPKVVFGSYVTDRKKGTPLLTEDWKMFDMGVEKYILLCSEGTHDDKVVFGRPDVNIRRIDGLTTARNLQGSYLLVITKKEGY